MLKFNFAKKLPSQIFEFLRKKYAVSKPKFKEIHLYFRAKKNEIDISVRIFTLSKNCVHDATQGGHTKKAPRVNDYL